MKPSRAALSFTGKTFRADGIGQAPGYVFVECDLPGGEEDSLPFIALRIAVSNAFGFLEPHSTVHPTHDVPAQLRLRPGGQVLTAFYIISSLMLAA